MVDKPKSKDGDQSKGVLRDLNALIAVVNAEADSKKLRLLVESDDYKHLSEKDKSTLEIEIKQKILKLGEQERKMIFDILEGMIKNVETFNECEELKQKFIDSNPGKKIKDNTKASQKFNDMFEKKMNEIVESQFTKKEAELVSAFNAFSAAYLLDQSSDATVKTYSELVKNLKENEGILKYGESKIYEKINAAASAVRDLKPEEAHKEITPTAKSMFVREHLSTLYESYQKSFEKLENGVLNSAAINNEQNDFDALTDFFNKNKQELTDPIHAEIVDKVQKAISERTSPLATAKSDTARLEKTSSTIKEPSSVASNIDHKKKYIESFKLSIQQANTLESITRILKESSASPTYQSLSVPDQNNLNAVIKAKKAQISKENCAIIEHEMRIHSSDINLLKDIHNKYQEQFNNLILEDKIRIEKIYDDYMKKATKKDKKDNNPETPLLKAAVPPVKAPAASQKSLEESTNDSKETLIFNSIMNKLQNIDLKNITNNKKYKDEIEPIIQRIENSSGFKRLNPERQGQIKDKIAEINRSVDAKILESEEKLKQQANALAEKAAQAERKQKEKFDKRRKREEITQKNVDERKKAEQTSAEEAAVERTKKVEILAAAQSQKAEDERKRRKESRKERREAKDNNKVAVKELEAKEKATQEAETKAAKVRGEAAKEEYIKELEAKEAAGKGGAKGRELILNNMIAMISSIEDIDTLRKMKDTNSLIGSDAYNQLNLEEQFKVMQAYNAQDIALERKEILKGFLQETSKLDIDSLYKIATSKDIIGSNEYNKLTPEQQDEVVKKIEEMGKKIDSGAKKEKEVAEAQVEAIQSPDNPIEKPNNQSRVDEATPSKDSEAAPTGHAAESLIKTAPVEVAQTPNVQDGPMGSDPRGAASVQINETQLKDKAPVVQAEKKSLLTSFLDIFRGSKPTVLKPITTGQKDKKEATTREPAQAQQAQTAATTAVTPPPKPAATTTSNVQDGPKGSDPRGAASVKINETQLEDKASVVQAEKKSFLTSFLDILRRSKPVLKPITTGQNDKKEATTGASAQAQEETTGSMRSDPDPQQQAASSVAAPTTDPQQQAAAPTPQQQSATTSVTGAATTDPQPPRTTMEADHDSVSAEYKKADEEFKKMLEKKRERRAAEGTYQEIPEPGKSVEQRIEEERERIAAEGTYQEIPEPGKSVEQRIEEESERRAAEGTYQEIPEPDKSVEQRIEKERERRAAKDIYQEIPNTPTPIAQQPTKTPKKTAAATITGAATDPPQQQPAAARSVAAAPTTDPQQQSAATTTRVTGSATTDPQQEPAAPTPQQQPATKSVAAATNTNTNTSPSTTTPTTKRRLGITDGGRSDAGFDYKKVSPEFIKKVYEYEALNHEKKNKEKVNRFLETDQELNEDDSFKSAIKGYISGQYEESNQIDVSCNPKSAFALSDAGPSNKQELMCATKNYSKNSTTLITHNSATGEASCKCKNLKDPNHIRESAIELATLLVSQRKNPNSVIKLGEGKNKKSKEFQFLVQAAILEIDPNAKIINNNKIDPKVQAHISSRQEKMMKRFDKVPNVLDLFGAIYNNPKLLEENITGDQAIEMLAAGTGRSVDEVKKTLKDGYGSTFFNNNEENFKALREDYNHNLTRFERTQAIRDPDGESRQDLKSFKAFYEADVKNAAFTRQFLRSDAFIDSTRDKENKATGDSITKARTQIGEGIREVRNNATASNSPGLSSPPSTENNTTPTPVDPLRPRT